MKETTKREHLRARPSSERKDGEEMKESRIELCLAGCQGKCRRSKLVQRALWPTVALKFLSEARRSCSSQPHVLLLYCALYFDYDCTRDCILVTGRAGKRLI